LRKIALLALCLGISCHSYSPVRIVKKVEAPSADAGDLAPRKAVQKIYLYKHFAMVRSFSPAAKINNRGVEFALRGEFREASILFREAAKEDPVMGAAFNNLGIVFEIAGNSEKAFAMYSKACQLEPGNRHFRNNFLYGVKDDDR
jgi:tetratricopeptide (TPR) repeat protein